MNSKLFSILVTTALLLSISTLSFSSTTQTFIPPLELKGFHVVGTLSPNDKVTFTLFIPLKNVGLLYYYALAVSNPSSPLYHHFLTREQVEELFYPTQQYEQVLSYLKQSGFNIILTAADSVIIATGTVGQVEKYLGLNFEVLSNGTLTYYTSYGVPKIPAFVISSNVSAIFFQHPSTLVTIKDVMKLKQEAGLPNTTFPIEAYWPTALYNAYNITPLFNQGYEGQGFNIGILDFYGDPYIYQQLVYYDKVTGLPNPPNFTVVPIGPYNPALGIVYGWAGEISLDVEVAHTMAPKANITLYIANPNLPLSSVIAYIVSQDKVNVLSQSFGIPESAFSNFFNGPGFYSCVVLTDEYYAMGSAEGITFLASSGDGGGSGYSNGPIGAVDYPSVSPFVTAVGGTTTYIQFHGGVEQTAWSNYGFVPNDVNFGGSTGGVSIIEPKPWWQWSLQTPATYPNGRTTPDISANANVYPGIYIICPYNVTAINGGTSEASPLTAGILTTIMSYLNHSLGLINPTIYELANSHYEQVFNPITFGYNIPWTANYGYNLITGWGTLNSGNLAYYLKTTKTNVSNISIVVNVYNTSGETPLEFFPGQVMEIVANITMNGIPVTNGSFYAIIEGIEGNLTETQLAYNPSLKEWVATVTLPQNANGLLFVTVYGNGSYGFVETFSGYYVQFFTPATFTPFDTQVSNVTEANVTNVYGVPANFTLSLNVYSYNITDNEYIMTNSTVLTPISTYGPWVGTLNAKIGDDLLIATNAYGFVAFSNGIYLQSLFILPQIVAEPGSIAGGQYIIIEGQIVPPTLPPQYFTTESDILYGTNVTAELVSPNGKVISETVASLSPFGEILGFLYVPKNVTAGLYTVLLFAKYDSYTLGINLTGFFYGQIYVTPNYNTPIIKTAKYAYEGQTLLIYANIEYPNGSEVKYGMYSAFIYPQILSQEYPQISTEIEIPLWFNSTLNEWVGNVTLPSSSNLGNLTYLSSTTYFGLPFDIMVNGISFNGVPTINNYNTSYTFYVYPYTLVKGQHIDEGETYNAVLENDIITGKVTLVNDILINDTIEGNVSIINSNITYVNAEGSNLTLVNSYVNSLTALNTKVYLVSTSVNELNLEGSSSVEVINSQIINVTPSLPKVNVKAPMSATGEVNVSITVSGEDVSQVMLYIDNTLLTTFSGNGTFVYTLNTANYPDGTYTLKVVAMQSDGLSSTYTTHIQVENQLESLNNKLSTLNDSLSTISSSLSSVNSNLSGKVSTLQIISIIGIIIAIVAIALALVRRK
ncbi:protease pro-enzyme activation domain-containing protein [Sulfolobaceae archaeon RB850M]